MAELHYMKEEKFTRLNELIASEGREDAWARIHEEGVRLSDQQRRGIKLLVLGGKLSAYPTNLGEDALWLEDNTEHSRKRLALELRESERRILMDWIEHIQGRKLKYKAHTRTSESASKKRKHP